jgi:murein DD-endopeptidase MepM/ murein hydrolase activator NlpD
VRRPSAAAALLSALLVPTASAYVASPVKPKRGPPRFQAPVPGALESPYGYRWGRMHNGVDLEGETGDPVRAALPGVVTAAGYLRSYSGYGLTVRVRHGGRIETMYAHLSSASVRVGEPVAAGDMIGRVGCTGSCTGNHLHFEVRVRGALVDPLRYIKTAVR